MSTLLARARIIIGEGNISAGKSTLCRELARELGYELFMEPVVTNPYLELYYGCVLFSIEFKLNQKKSFIKRDLDEN